MEKINNQISKKKEKKKERNRKQNAWRPEKQFAEEFCKVQSQC